MRTREVKSTAIRCEQMFGKRKRMEQVWEGRIPEWGLLSKVRVLIVVVTQAVEEKITRNVFPNNPEPTHPWHGLHVRPPRLFCWNPAGGVKGKLGRKRGKALTFPEEEKQQQPANLLSLLPLTFAFHISFEPWISPVRPPFYRWENWVPFEFFSHI